MMNFRLVKTSIVNILGNAELGRYRTIGFQRQKSAEKVLNENRTVQAYYASGNFPNIGRFNVQHDLTIKLELTASAATEIDLSALDNPDATDAERAQTLSEAKPAAENIHDQLDEFFEIIYQIIMDARNVDLGFSPGVVANRWIPSFQKDPVPWPSGQYMCLSGLVTLNLRCAEEIQGDRGVDAAGGIFENQIDIVGDDIEKTGVSVTIEEEA